MKQQKCNTVDLSTIKVRRSDEDTMAMLFDRQIQLLLKIEERKPQGFKVLVNKADVPDSLRIKLMIDMIGCLHNELEELRDALPWKGWKDYSGYSLKKEMPEIKYEIIDLLHFVLNLAIISGMKPVEVLQIYISKNEQNKDRQKKGY